MARPTLFTEEKIKILKDICRLKPRLEDCAAILDMDASTIEKFIKRTYNCSFSEFRDQNMVHSRFMIIRRILELCDQGNPLMLIYASKNLCGWSDKVTTESHEKNEIKIEISKAESEL